MKKILLKKNVLAWCLYDFANSAFAVIVLAGFFPIIFKSFWNSDVDPVNVTARLGMGNTISGIIIALLSPVIGAFSDVCKNKKKFLILFMIGGIFCTFFLFFIEKGMWLFALALFITANICFSCGNLFYDSLLVDIAEKKEMDVISSAGFAFGYLGGGVLLLITFIFTAKYYLFGFSIQIKAMLLSFPFVSVWWVIFSLPLFVFVKEKSIDYKLKPFLVIKQGFIRLFKTCSDLIKDKTVLVFLIAYWFYMDGVYTFISMSVDFGLSLGFKPIIMLIALLIVQFVAFPSSLLIGYASNFWGTIKTILFLIGIYFFVCVIGSFLLKTPKDFIILSCFIAFAQGGIQALSRSFYAKIISKENASEYFGILNIIGKFSVILGPFLVGMSAIVAKKFVPASQLASRISMASISIIFIMGALFLYLTQKSIIKKNIKNL